MIQVFKSSAKSEVSRSMNVSTSTVGRLVFEIADEGGWSGTIQVAARLNGRGRDGAESFDTFLPITRRSDGTFMANTGVTEEGLYDVDVAGLEVQFQHNRVSGACSVYVLPLMG